jgi:hypothetical protein
MVEWITVNGTRGRASHRWREVGGTMVRVDVAAERTGLEPESWALGGSSASQ